MAEGGLPFLSALCQLCTLPLTQNGVYRQRRCEASEDQGCIRTPPRELLQAQHQCAQVRLTLIARCLFSDQVAALSTDSPACRKYYRYFNLTYTPDYTKDELAKDAYTHFSGLVRLVNMLQEPGTGQRRWMTTTTQPQKDVWILNLPASGAAVDPLVACRRSRRMRSSTPLPCATTHKLAGWFTPEQEPVPVLARSSAATPSP